MWFSMENNLATDILQLYALLVEILRGRSVFYYNPSGQESSWTWLQRHNLSSQPQWTWHNPIPYVRLKEQHNSEIFVLSFLSDNYNQTDLNGLTKSLIHLRHVDVLIECKTQIGRTRDSQASEILAHFLQHNMLNVVLYFQHNPLELYSFQAFPQFKLILRRNFSNWPGVELFPNQLEDLRGYTLRILPDLSEPNTIDLTDANGQIHIRGFMWDFIETFVRKIGGGSKVIYPTWPRGQQRTESYALEMTRNRTLDIGLATAQLNRINFNRFYQYSYPILHGSWAIMLPLERPIEMPTIFRHIWKIGALTLLLIGLILYWLSSWIAGLCGFPRWQRYWSLFFLWIFCLCQAQMLFLLTWCPREAPIDSFDALLASNLRILVVNSEFYLLDGEFRARYATAFRLTNDVNEFFALRNSFNTSYGYSITSNKWGIMETQQRNFQRSVYRYSDLFLHGTIPYSLILDEDSLYYEAIKLYTMKIDRSGLLKYWQTYSFYDMVKAGRMQFKDYSLPIQPRPLRLQDFRIPCCYYSFGIVLAWILFAFELICYHIPVFLDNL